jgi:osmotically-inducible protein OsmY
MQITLGAALAATLTLVVGCSTTPPKSPEQARADAATTDRVYAALNDAPYYYFRDVDVAVDSGVVHLSGYVFTTFALDAAQKIARGVPGVVGVRDEMELERAAARGGGDGGGH